MKHARDSRQPIFDWQLLDDHDLDFYARSFRTAAETLRDAALEPGGLVSFDACPILYMYRLAVELHLKVIVLGEGANFLTPKPDRLSTYKTHSVSWLGQHVAQLVTRVGWENEFKCDGIDNLTDFKALLAELNESGPVSYGFRVPGDSDYAALAASVREFARRTEALLTLLAVTADALAAEWALRSGDNELPARVN